MECRGIDCGVGMVGVSNGESRDNYKSTIKKQIYINKQTNKQIKPFLLPQELHRNHQYRNPKHTYNAYTVKSNRCSNVQPSLPELIQIH